MVNQQLAQYILTERARGVADEMLRTELIGKGWDASEVELAINPAVVGMGSGEIPGAAALIGQAHEALKENFFVFYGLIFCVSVLGIIIQFFGLRDGMTSSLSYSFNPTFIAVSLVMAIVSMYVSAGVYAALIRGGKCTPGDVLSLAGDCAVRYIFVSIVAGLIIGLGLVILIIPGIIFMVWYVFAGLAAITNRSNGVGAALAESKALSQGRWMQVFVRLILGFVGIMVPIYIINGIVVAALSYIASGVLVQAVSAAIIVFSTVYIIGYTFVLYRALAAK